MCNLHYIIWRNFTRRKLLVFNNTTNSNFNRFHFKNIVFYQTVKSIIFLILIARTSNLIHIIWQSFTRRELLVIDNTTNSNFNGFHSYILSNSRVNCLLRIFINCIIGLAYYADNSVLRSKNTHCLPVSTQADEQSRFSFHLLACTAKTYSCIIQRIAEELFPTFNT